MAQWASANLSNLLPSAVDDAISAVQGLVTVVTTPLEAVKTILGLAESVIVGLPPLNWTELLASIVEDLKSEFLGTGYYYLDLWDYPIQKQLSPTSFGPDSDEDLFLKGFSGTQFREFLSDIDQSFDDDNDSSRPQFNGSCAMLVIVAATTDLDELYVSTEEDNIGDGWPGLQKKMGDAARVIRSRRWLGAWSRLRRIAEIQPSSYTASRVHRLQQARRVWERLDEDERDAIPFPPAFFEDITISLEEVDWEEEVEPILEALEAVVIPPEYPDWTRNSLREIHPGLFALIDEAFDAALDLFATGTSIKQALLDMIQAIQDKLDELDRIIERIDELLDEIDNLLNIVGLHALFLTSNTGVDDLRTKLLNATNVPFTGENFYTGMVILAGGSSVSAFTALFGSIVDS